MSRRPATSGGRALPLSRSRPPPQPLTPPPSFVRYERLQRGERPADPHFDDADDWDSEAVAEAGAGLGVAALGGLQRRRRALVTGVGDWWEKGSAAAAQMRQKAAQQFNEHSRLLPKGKQETPL